MESMEKIGDNGGAWENRRQWRDIVKIRRAWRQDTMEGSGENRRQWKDFEKIGYNREGLSADFNRQLT